MPGLQTALGKLNCAFGRQGIKETAKQREKFAPGMPLAAGIVIRRKTALHTPWSTYIGNMPLSMQEAIRSILYHALGTSPPTEITFAWAPGYDYEVTIWDAPDTRMTRGGITILVKSRYPDDKHPLAGEPAYGSSGPRRNR